MGSININKISPMLLLTLTILFFSSAAQPQPASATVKPAAPAATNTLQVSRAMAAIETMCKKTSYPVLCSKSIARNFNFKATVADPKTIFQASVKAALSETTACMNRIDALIKVEKNKSDLSGLELCKKYYVDAIETIEGVANGADPGSVTDAMNFAISGISTCEDDVMESVGKVKKFTDRTKNAMDNSLALASYAH